MDKIMREYTNLRVIDGNHCQLNLLPQKETPILVIGVGNAYRSDDAVGLIVAQGLKRGTPDCINIIEKGGDGAALMECWEGAGTVILIDAVHSGGLPGTIHRLNAHAQPVPARYFHGSTHAFGVAEAVEMSRTLNQLPPRFIIYGIEGKSFEPGCGITEAVAKAAQDVLGQIQHDIASFCSLTTINSLEQIIS